MTVKTGDEFVRAFARGLLNKAGLTLAPEREKRFLAELERAVQQRLGVALFEQLNDDDMKEVIRDFLNSDLSAQITNVVRRRIAHGQELLHRELAKFAAEFLHAVRTN